MKGLPKNEKPAYYCPVIRVRLVRIAMGVDRHILPLCTYFN